MPNHCNNTLGIIGLTKDVESFLNLVKVKIKSFDDDDFEIFNGLMPMPKELDGTKKNYEPESKNEDLIEKYGFDNWYDWCNSNWGTKWGDYETQSDGIDHISEYKYPVLEDGSKDYENSFKELTGESLLHFSYDTAWSPGAEELANAICKQFPTLRGFISYEEPGMCFAGNLVFQNGKIISNDSWESHYLLRDVNDVTFSEGDE
jgi:hypothetical protein